MLSDPEVLAARIAKRAGDFGAAVTRVSHEIERAEEWFRGLPFVFPFSMPLLPGGRLELVRRGKEDWQLQVCYPVSGGEEVTRRLTRATIEDKLKYAGYLRTFVIDYCRRQEELIAAADALVPIGGLGDGP
jgi:hypothetical protein